MEDIHKLTDCINLHFNSGVTIISHKNWKMLEWNFSKRKYHESTLLKLNSNKALKSIKWKNKLKFKEVIKLVADWYKCFYEKKNIYDLSINQIKYFEKK